MRHDDPASGIDISKRLSEATARRFAASVLDWFGVHGRKDLPWQRDPTAYRVWVSEIMLQQTQVATVIPFYERFMARFPDLATLAAASEDEVLAHWSGLGYYARGRNLHRAARDAIVRHGELPLDLDALVALPGIGRSTAGAILSLADDQPVPILDGNVKRVLARHFAVEGWPGQGETLKTLWRLSERVTPTARTGAFNQAMMDLGATLCRRGRPDCSRCPIATGCLARALDATDRLPASRPKRVLPERDTVMLCLVRRLGGESAVLLEKRPASGIWGGLWSLPEIATIDSLSAGLGAFGLVATGDREHIASLQHGFTHYRLAIDVHEVSVAIDDARLMETRETVWYKGGPLPGGVAAPVRRILDEREGSLL